MERIKTIHITAMVLAVLTFVLIVWGGHVNTTRSGMAFADWPTSNGVAMITYAPSEWFLQGAKFWEHGHRLLATVVGLVTSFLVVIVYRSTPLANRPGKLVIGILSAVLAVVATGIIGLHSMPSGFLEIFMVLLVGMLIFSVVRALSTSGTVRILWLSVSAFIGVCLQGTFGGYTVLHSLPDWTSTTHGMLAEFFFLTVLGIVVVSSPKWNSQLKNGGLRKITRNLIGATWAMIVAQFLLGALTRHTDAWGVSVTFPAWSDTSFFPTAEMFAVGQVVIQFAHRTTAYLVGVLAVASWILIYKDTEKKSLLRRLSTASMVMVAVQIGLGVSVLFTFRGEVVTTLHVMGGVLLLALSSLQLMYSAKGSPALPSADVEYQTDLSLKGGLH